MDSLLSQASKLPQKCGVYLFKNQRGKVLYVGKAIDLRSRVKSYFQGQDTRPKIPLLISQTTTINHIVVNSEFEALLLEAALIKKHLPRFNTVAKDDKQPLYIAITKEEFPKVRVIRRTQDTGKAQVFGPFPSASTVRQVLKFVRRIFPYCSCKTNSGRPCLYADIGLCKPCPREIFGLKYPGGDRLGSPGVAELQIQLTKQYRKQMRLLTKLLKGQTPQVLRAIQRNMIQAAKIQDYELAAFYRDGLKNLQSLLQPQQPAHLYIENPNLRLEILQQGWQELKTVLNQNHLQPQLTQLNRVEGYDISTLSGQYSTGSLVVFSHGEPNKSQYRRFKIKREGKPNDVQMMTEMLQRRFFRQQNKNSPSNKKIVSWPMPDLLVVDGGKPQINAALHVLNHYQIDIPIIGLAKKQEEIIIYTGQKLHKFNHLRLSASSLSLQIIQHLRDEAHRFANKYRKHLLSRR